MNCMQCGSTDDRVYGDGDFFIIPEDECYCAECLCLIFDEAFANFAQEIVKFHNETGLRPDAYEIVEDSVLGGKH